MLKNLRFSTKLVVVGTILMIIPLAAVTYIATQRSALAITAIETEQLGRAAHLIATSINDVFLEEQKFAVALASEEDIVKAALAYGEPESQHAAGRGSTGTVGKASLIALTPSNKRQIGSSR